MDETKSQFEITHEIVVKNIFSTAIHHKHPMQKHPTEFSFETYTPETIKPEGEELTLKIQTKITN